VYEPTFITYAKSVLLHKKYIHIISDQKCCHITCLKVGFLVAIYYILKATHVKLDNVIDQVTWHRLIVNVVNYHLLQTRKCLSRNKSNRHYTFQKLNTYKNCTTYSYILLQVFQI